MKITKISMDEFELMKRFKNKEIYRPVVERAQGLENGEALKVDLDTNSISVASSARNFIKRMLGKDYIVTRKDTILLIAKNKLG